MQMTLSITAESPSEMVTVLQALQGAGVVEPVRMVANAVPQAESMAAPAKPRGRPPKEKEPEPPLQKTESSKLKVVPKEKVPEPAKKELTALDVRQAMTAYLAANSEKAAGELLAEHGNGCTRLSQLDPALYQAVYDAAVTPAKTNVLDDEIPF